MEAPPLADLTADDDRKVFVSRIPRSYQDDDLFTKFEERFGPNSVEVANVAYDEEMEQGKGFGFVVFKTKTYKIEALKARTVKAKKNSMYVRNVQREGREGRGRDKGGICFLWQSGNCSHGDNCRFKHEGHGSVEKKLEKKPKKCFKFKKGKCLDGDACRFRHVGVPNTSNSSGKDDKHVREDKEKPCFNWKKKGKCNKGMSSMSRTLPVSLSISNSSIFYILLYTGDQCKFSHAIDVVDKKKVSNNNSNNNVSNNKKEKISRKREKYDDKSKSETNVRIFGLNYDTTKGQVEHFFQK